MQRPRGNGKITREGKERRAAVIPFRRTPNATYTPRLSYVIIIHRMFVGLIFCKFVARYSTRSVVPWQIQEGLTPRIIITYNTIYYYNRYNYYIITCHQYILRIFFSLIIEIYRFINIFT